MHPHLFNKSYPQKVDNSCKTSILDVKIRASLILFSVGNVTLSELFKQLELKIQETLFIWFHTEIFVEETSLGWSTTLSLNEGGMIF